MSAGQERLVRLPPQDQAVRQAMEILDRAVRARDSSGREAPIKVVGTTSTAKHRANTASGASTRPAMDKASQS